MPGIHRLRGGRCDGHDLAREGVLEQGQLFGALDPTELLFDLDQGRGTPPQFLVTRAPPIDTTRLGLDARHHALDQVRGLEARAEFGEHAESMQRERLFQALVETARRRFVAQRQLAPEPLQGTLGIDVAWVGAYAACSFRRHTSCWGFVR